jgi:succinate dehydrogenase / fumarate reductase flavoprotein subunit
VQDAADELQGLIKPGTELARPLQRALRNLMWEHCGVVRDEARMREGLRKLGELAEAAQTVDIRPGEEGWFELEHVLDLRAGLRTAEATLRCALERRESRGAHNRSDFPAVDPGLRRNLYTRLDQRHAPLTVSSEPVPDIPAPLHGLLAADELPIAGRLLE